MIDNYNDFLKFLNTIDKTNKPTLLLHVCCAPCSSHVLTLLKDYFDITAFFYNPNIVPEEEYITRFKEFDKLNKITTDSITIINGNYDISSFYDNVEKYKDMPEGSQRCFSCYYFRLEETAKLAATNKFDYFTTTLSISPYKNSNVINQQGLELSEKYNVSFLYSNFKKASGYQNSIKLSKEYELYRQDYCGCPYSIKEHHERVKKHELSK